MDRQVLKSLDPSLTCSGGSNEVGITKTRYEPEIVLLMTFLSKSFHIVVTFLTKP